MGCGQLKEPGVDKPCYTTQQSSRGNVGVSLISIEDAIGQRSYMDAQGCTNCRGCYYCFGCADCTFCSHCMSCTDCTRCAFCSYCEHLTHAAYQGDRHESQI